MSKAMPSMRLYLCSPLVISATIYTVVQAINLGVLVFYSLILFI